MKTRTFLLTLLVSVLIFTFSDRAYASNPIQVGYLTSSNNISKVQMDSEKSLDSTNNQSTEFNISEIQKEEWIEVNSQFKQSEESFWTPSLKELENDLTVKDKLNKSSTVLNSMALGTKYESEPNNTIGTADSILLDYYVYGTITNYYYDLDYYRLQVSQSGTLNIIGIWVGDYASLGWEDDLAIGLLDSSGNVIKWCSYIQFSDGTACQEMNLNITPGTYYIVVFQASDYEYLYVGEAYGFTAWMENVSTPVQSVSLNKTNTSLTKGNSETLSATVLPANATNKSVSWSSNNNSVATVDASGKVTAVEVGTAVVTVTTADGGYTGKCNVTVTLPVSIASLTSNKTSPQTAPVTVRWTCSAAGPTSIQYAFYVYKDGTKIYTKWYSADNFIDYTCADPGSYKVLAFAKAPDGTRTSKYSPVLVVETAQPPVINSVTADKTSPQTAPVNVRWTCDASGPAGLKYAFYVYNNGAKVYTKWYAADNYIDYTCADPGSYKVLAFAKATNGSIVSEYSGILTVEAASALAINSVTADVASPQKAPADVRWTCDASGPAGIQYAWYLFKDGTKVYTKWYSTDNYIDYTCADPGSYKALAFAKATNGSIVSKYSGTLTVEAASALAINSVTADVASPQKAPADVRWTCDASGPAGIQYAWYLFKDDTKVYTKWYSTDNYIDYTCADPGSYKALAFAKATNGSIVSMYSSAIVVEGVTLAPSAASQADLETLIETVTDLENNTYPDEIGPDSGHEMEPGFDSKKQTDFDLKIKNQGQNQGKNRFN